MRIKDLICKVQSSSLCFRAWHHFKQIQARVPCESVAARRNTLMTTRTSPSQRNRKKRRCPKQRIPRPDTDSVITKTDRKTCGSQDGCRAWPYFFATKWFFTHMGNPPRLDLFQVISFMNVQYILCSQSLWSANASKK